MLDKSKNVFDMVRQMQDLYKEIGGFMRYFEKIVGENDYEPITNSSTVIKEISQSLNDSESWLPIWMYRTYQNKKNKNELMSINIALDYPLYRDRIIEPLVLISKIEGKKIDREFAWYPWDIYFHFRTREKQVEKQKDKVYLLKDLDLDNKDTEEEGVIKGNFEAIEKLKFIAVPLMEIENEKAIKAIIEKLINPLLEVE
ncbi:MAG: hypothetical protein CVU77_06160 [Elusimicrobia bacterium HGW-Elusimicrobia-1]|jgi:hypothetical protein|nr:MAG: hypothetical protein CVU77_06160 [Elusimicrobia bacterium HGW-Elusimicrobia-1]